MRRVLVPIGLALLALAALPAVGGAAVTLQPLGPEFEQPIAVAGAPGDGERLYVAEQRGTIQAVRGGEARLFADLSSDVRGPGDGVAGGEEGLLGLAFAPDFATSRLLYVYYTDMAGDIRLDELRAPTGDSVDGFRRNVLTLAHPGATNHNGGTIRFGPDGYLWLAPGDGASGANARSLASPLGKVLRIDPRGAAPGQYAIPPDNPFVGTPGARGEIWAWGLRNPFRFAFDRLTGDLVIGDVGQGTTEEIDHLPAASGRGRGADLGWDVCEGSFVLGSRDRACTLPNAVAPAIDRFRDEGFRSIIAGPVVRDPSLPSLNGRLVYGDYFVDALRTAALDAGGGKATDDREVGPGATVQDLTSLSEDAAGCVYATSGQGRVYRLVELDGRIPCALPPGSPGQPRAPGGGTPGGGGTDGAPRLRAGVIVRQRVLTNGGPIVRVRCDRPCRVAVGGRLRIGRRSFPLVRAERRGAARELLRLKPRLRRRAAAALRDALADGRRPKVFVRVRARDADGDRSPLLTHTVRAIG